MMNEELFQVEESSDSKVVTRRVAVFPQKTPVKFEQERPPEKIDVLIAKGVINEIPQDPYGGEFYIDKDGSIKTTSELR